MKKEMDHMKRKNKKGITAVVATVLIILITVAAVTLIWTAIIPLTSEQLDSGTACLNAIQQIEVGERSCKDDVAGEIQLQLISSSKELGLSDIQVLIDKDGNTDSIMLKEQGILSELPGPNEQKLITLTLADVADISGVAIAPVVRVENTDTFCAATEFAALSDC